ncbi:hypothetical protein [Geodermatophilus sp. SYSU D01105]
MGIEQTVAARLGAAVQGVLGVDELPVRLRAWDGSLAGPDGAPVIAVRSRRAVRRLVWSPGELGLGRAYVAGELDLEGDVFDTLAALSSAGRLASDDAPPLTLRERADLVRTAASLGALGP